MFTFVTWPNSIIILSVFWLFLLFGRRSFLRHQLKRRIKSFDLLLPIFLWVIQSISFQSWHSDILSPLLLVFTFWGMGIALWQGFVSQRFTFRYFFKIWWRLMSLASFVLLCILAIISVI